MFCFRVVLRNKNLYADFWLTHLFERFTHIYKPDFTFLFLSYCVHIKIHTHRHTSGWLIWSKTLWKSSIFMWEECKKSHASSTFCFGVIMFINTLKDRLLLYEFGLKFGSNLQYLCRNHIRNLGLSCLQSSCSQI